MTKAKSGTSELAVMKKKIASKKLPASYYEGQKKNAKPERDKNGDIIPK